MVSGITFGTFGDRSEVDQARNSLLKVIKANHMSKLSSMNGANIDDKLPKPELVSEI